MKNLAYLFLVFIIISCNNTQKAEQTEVATETLTEIKLDSLGIEKFFADSTLQNIAATEIKGLTQNLADTSLFAGLDDGFLRLDSIKKAGGYEDYLSKLDIGMYKDIRAVHFKDINLDKSTSLTLWDLIILLTRLVHIPTKSGLYQQTCRWQKRRMRSFFLFSQLGRCSFL